MVRGAGGISVSSPAHDAYTRVEQNGGKRQASAAENARDETRNGYTSRQRYTSVQCMYRIVLQIEIYIEILLYNCMYMYNM